MTFTAIAINCSLKHRDGEPSSTDHMIDLLAGEMKKHGIQFEGALRLADHNILPGVRSDEGPGDDWPEIRSKILAADILIFGTPIWLGQMSSIAKRVLERMDAFLGETDERGRTPASGKVAVAAIVGNEDGAHAITADLFQGLNDMGWTIPASSACYWVGEAMHKTDFKDLEKVPGPVAETAAMLASNSAHLAKLLKESQYPGVPQKDDGKPQ